MELNSVIGMSVGVAGAAVMILRSTSGWLKTGQAGLAADRSPLTG